MEKTDEEETDVAHMVDLVMKQNDEIKARIQVKPDSFYHESSYVQKLHDELDYPVHHLIYDAEGGGQIILLLQSPISCEHLLTR